MDGKDLEIWMIVNLTNIFAKYAQRTASWLTQFPVIINTIFNCHVYYFYRYYSSMTHKHQ